MVWAAIVATEFDGQSEDWRLAPTAMGPHVFHRHHVGVGSVAAAWVFHRVFALYVEALTWRGRAASVLLRLPACDRRGAW